MYLRVTMSEERGKRINKWLSESGFCSRRAADKLIEQGKVTINGKVPELGTRIGPDDEVRVDGQLIGEKKVHRVYLALHKPRGIVCTTDLRERDNIVDYVGYPERIFPIGRLDKDSEGLILLTNDGDIVNKVLRARYGHEKEYVVTVDKPIDQEFVRRMSSGIPILDTVTLECKVTAIGERRFKIVLTQGLNRQIRRMCEYLGYRVRRLKRIRIMHVQLDVPLGKWRYLTDDELERINASTDDHT